MSNRLTSSARADSPIWSSVSFLWLTAATGLLVYSQVPSSPPVIAEEAHELYLRLPSPLWTPRIQAVVLTLVFLLSGALIRLLSPAKASGHVRTLAMILGAAVPAVLLTPLLSGAMGPQPLFPAWALALISGCLLFPGGGTSRTPLLGLSGLTAGLALSLDAATLAVAAVSLVWVASICVTSKKTGGPGLVFWLVGLALGMIPVFLGWVPFAPGLVFTDGLSGLEGIPSQLLDLLTWASLPFILLALLAAGLQLQKILLAWMLPVVVLQLVQAAGRSDPLPETLFFLALPFCWLTAYGVLRLIKGIEQGVRNVNTKKARRIFPVTTGLILAAYTGCSVYLLLNP